MSVEKNGRVFKRELIVDWADHELKDKHKNVVASVQDKHRIGNRLDKLRERKIKKEFDELNGEKESGQKLPAATAAELVNGTVTSGVHASIDGPIGGTIGGGPTLSASKPFVPADAKGKGKLAVGSGFGKAVLGKPTFGKDGKPFGIGKDGDHGYGSTLITKGGGKEGKEGVLGKPNSVPVVSVGASVAASAAAQAAARHDYDDIDLIAFDGPQDVDLEDLEDHLNILAADGKDGGAVDGKDVEKYLVNDDADSDEEFERMMELRGKANKQGGNGTSGTNPFTKAGHETPTVEEDEKEEKDGEGIPSDEIAPEDQFPEIPSDDDDYFGALLKLDEDGNLLTDLSKCRRPMKKEKLDDVSEQDLYGNLDGDAHNPFDDSVAVGEMPKSSKRGGETAKKDARKATEADSSLKASSGRMDRWSLKAASSNKRSRDQMESDGKGADDLTYVEKKKSSKPAVATAKTPTAAGAGTISGAGISGAGISGAASSSINVGKSSLLASVNAGVNAGINANSAASSTQAANPGNNPSPSSIATALNNMANNPNGLSSTQMCQKKGNQLLESMGPKLRNLTHATMTVLWNKMTNATDVERTLYMKATTSLIDRFDRCQEASESYNGGDDALYEGFTAREMKDALRYIRQSGQTKNFVHWHIYNNSHFLSESGGLASAVAASANASRNRNQQNSQLMASISPTLQQPQQQQQQQALAQQQQQQALAQQQQQQPVSAQQAQQQALQQQAQNAMQQATQNAAAMQNQQDWGAWQQQQAQMTPQQAQQLMMLQQARQQAIIQQQMASGQFSNGGMM